ncbi:hypothetical protein [Methanococcus maripaludis]|uniref:hypothetical protein n=1 Tax=Methanococcus maripaludis TaxID=39152 RepID=UPI0015EBC1AD|nr:hypothetical protein [Methanococcus maripaludis]
MVSLKVKIGDFISKNGYVIYIIKIHQNGLIRGFSNYSGFPELIYESNLDGYEQVLRKDLSRIDVSEINRAITNYNNLKTTVNEVPLVV